MHTTITGRAKKVSAAALLVLALAACGSETAESSGDSSDGTPEARQAALTDQPFCDRVDTATVAEVLDMPAGKVRTRVDREVGEEFEGPNEEAGPVTSVANLCVFGSTTSQFLVSVQPDATSADVQETVDDLNSLTGDSSETCESGDASGFGDPAAVFTCTSATERVRVVATGLVGDSKFYCAAMMNLGAGDDFRQKTLDACSTALEELSTEA